MKITYWSDYACPYCYIGEARLKKALADFPELEDVDIEMKAFQLDPTAGEHAAGDTQTRFAKKYRISMDQAAETIEGISQMGREEGLDFKYASTLFTNTMDAHRLTKLAASKGNAKLTDRLIDRLFEAYFSENKELADKARLQSIGEECGLDASEVKEVLDSDKYRDEVLLDEREASLYGVHAVPFFVIDGYGLSGVHPVEGLKDVIRKAMADAASAAPAEGMVCGPDGCKLGG